MIRTKSLIFATVASLAMVALVTPASSPAKEGPFFKVDGNQLAPNEEVLLLASAKEAFRFLVPTLSLTITCTALSAPVDKQMQLIGASPGNGDLSKMVIDFTACTQTGNGTPCTIVNQLIATVPILGLLGFSKARSGSALVLFEPEKGSVLSTIKFTGTGCVLASAAVTGSVVGAARVGGAPVVLEGQESLFVSQHGEVAFPHPNLIFVEKASALKHIVAALSVAGVAASLDGIALLSVHLPGGTSLAQWGIFS